MQNAITFARPDDWHQHLREGEAITTPLAHAAEQFGRIMVMPNLRQPICSSAQLGAYLAAIHQRMPQHSKLQVYGTLYLSPEITPVELATCMREQPLLAVKWYPRGVTTNSALGVNQVEACYPLFAAMQNLGVVLSVHGEVHNQEVDIFDREAEFIHRVLSPLMQQFPQLRIVLEHISTSVAVDFLHQYGGARLAATITAHHLLINRNNLLAGGIKPHLYCLPLAKREQDRQALVQAAISGKEYFFLGSDSAPHPKTDKESACGCAGCYTGAHVLELYAEAFDSAGAIDKLPDFASRFGAEFYRLPAAQGNIRLERSEHLVPQNYGDIVPFWAQRKLHWRVKVL